MFQVKINCKQHKLKEFGLLVYNAISSAVIYRVCQILINAVSGD